MRTLTWVEAWFRALTEEDLENIETLGMGVEEGEG